MPRRVLRVCLLHQPVVLSFVYPPSRSLHQQPICPHTTSSSLLPFSSSIHSYFLHPSDYTLSVHLCVYLLSVYSLFHPPVLVFSCCCNKISWQKRGVRLVHHCGDSRMGLETASQEQGINACMFVLSSFCLYLESPGLPSPEGRSSHLSSCNQDSPFPHAYRPTLSRL